MWVCEEGGVKILYGNINLLDFCTVPLFPIVSQTHHPKTLLPPPENKLPIFSWGREQEVA